MLKHLLIACLLLLGGCHTDSKTSMTLDTPAAATKSLAVIAEEIRQEYGIPGLAVAVVDSNGIREMVHLGVRAKASGSAIQSGDRFHLGSNSKAINGFIAARLVEAGALNWDTRFFDLYPELLAEANPAYHDMTLAELLSHRAGIQPFTDYAEIPDIEWPDDWIDAAKIVLAMPNVEPPAGTAFVYSNAGYTLAALMLERASGQHWESLLESQFNTVLGVSSKIGWPNEVAADQPWGHYESQPGTLSETPPGHEYHLPSALAPAGDLNLSLEQYAVFIQAHLNGLQGNGIYLSPNTWQYLHTAYPAYAIGWGEFVFDGKTYSVHDGSAGTFYCRSGFDRSGKAALIIMTNAASERVIAGVDQLTHAWLEGQF